MHLNVLVLFVAIYTDCSLFIDVHSLFLRECTVLAEYMMVQRHMHGARQQQRWRRKFILTSHRVGVRAVVCVSLLISTINHLSPRPSLDEQHCVCESPGREKWDNKMFVWVCLGYNLV